MHIVCSLPGTGTLLVERGIQPPPLPFPNLAKFVFITLSVHRYRPSFVSDLCQGITISNIAGKHVRCLGFPNSMEGKR